MPTRDMPRPSIPSRVPKQPSGAPYIIASAVLLLIIGVLLWYKLFRPVPVVAQTPVIQSVSATATVDPGYDLPPPPPLDAGSDADPNAKQKVSSSGSAGGTCAGACEGTNSPALESALRGAASSSRGCYERALRNNSMLQGRLKLSVRVASNGNVCGASVVEDGLHSPEVSSCVLSLFRSRPFPPPNGGSCVDVSIPVSFTPQEGKK